MLTDFEILCGLHERGLKIESVVAIDQIYSASNTPLQQIATFFAPARVYGFKSLTAFERAAEEEPQIFGFATVLVQCDSPIARQTCRSTALRVLVNGGLAFKMDNDRNCASKAECWRCA